MIRKTTFLKTTILASTLLLHTGCGSPDSSDNTDMDMDMNMDQTMRLPIASIGSIERPSENDANFSCLAMRPVPSSTAAAAEFSLEIKDFENDFHTEGLRVQVFANNKIDLDNCAAPDCVEGTTGTDGVVQMSKAKAVAGTWYAYRVFAKQGPDRDHTAVDSVQFNEIAPKAGNSNDGISVSIRTLDLIPTVLGFNRAPGTAILAGSISDCDGKDVRGTRVKILDSTGVEIEEGPRQEDPHYRYFDGDSFPSATQKFTHVDGLFAGANLPIPNGKSRDVVVEVYGRLAGDDTDSLFARADASIFPDTVTVLNLEPLYAD